ncbi:MAG TPA: TolC family protein [Myxococcales bacterium]|nr:TolC family protein [Myxococcales bacterium]
MIFALLLAAPLTLHDLQDRARQNDPRAQQAVAQLENAQGKRDEANWAWFPNFATTAYVAGPTPEHRLIGGDKDDDPTNPAHLTPGSTGTSIFHGEVGVVAHVDIQGVLPIWTFGKLTAGKEAGKHLVLATEALLQRARDQSAFDAARAYWGYQTARNADTSVQKIRDRLGDAQKTAAQLLKEKSSQLGKSDSLKLDYLAEEIEAQHVRAVKNRDLALTALRLLIGAQPQQQVEIAVQELPDAPAAPNADDVLRKALERRPETKAAAEGVAARMALVDLAKARMYPDLGIAFGARYTETTNADSPSDPFINNPYHESSAYVALGLQGTFDIPQKLARLHQAEADLRESLAVQAGAAQLVRLEIQQAMGDLVEAGQRWQRYVNQTSIGKQLATQASVAFDSGLGDARDLLEGTLLFARADGERLGALYDAQVAWAALEKAAGGPLQ